MSNLKLLGLRKMTRRNRSRSEPMNDKVERTDNPFRTRSRWNVK
ncbi:MAG: hypothetical protein ACYCPW_00965 [Nitrososphaerales archaeon]